MDGAAHGLLPAVLARVVARRRVRRAVTAAVAIVAVFGVLTGVAAVHGGRPPGQALPAGRIFIATSIMKNGRTEPVLAGTRIELSFSATGVGAYGGCNHMGAPARLTGGRLVLTRYLESTAKECGTVTDQENWLAMFLSSAPAFRLTGDDLFLTGDDAQLHLIDRRIADPDRPLVGPRWKVTSLVSPLGHITYSGVQPELRFPTDTTVEGFAGCNFFQAQAAVAGDRITLSAIVSTAKGCGETAAKAQTAVMNVLKQPLTYRIEADRLTLSAPDGTGLELQESK
jgi:heat shock protein HslJ